jgi:sugar lactone lactonase YvrE
LQSPAGGVAVDGKGNVYFSDSFNNVVRVVAKAPGTLFGNIVAAGDIYTLAGTGTAGFSGDGGLATSAELYDPQGLALDDYGNLYIADVTNSVIRRVNASNGNIETVAGTPQLSGSTGDSGPATSAKLSSPSGVAVDAYDNIYIADTNNSSVRMVDAATQHIYTIAGTGIYGAPTGVGPATGEDLAEPVGVAVDSIGDVFIEDLGNEAIFMVDPGTEFLSLVAGTIGMSGYYGDNQAPATLTIFGAPRALALDPQGNLYVADNSNNVIRMLQRPIPTSVSPPAAPGYLIAVNEAGSGFTSRFPEIYNVSTDTWLPSQQPVSPPGMPTPVGGPDGILSAPAVTALGSGVLVAGGGPRAGVDDNHTTTNYAQVFDVQLNQWTAIPPMLRDRNQFALVTLHDGRAMAIGGCAGACAGPSQNNWLVGNVAPTAEIYDPVANTWTLTPNMAGHATGNRASNPAAVVLASGDVLVCGGGDGSSNFYPDCEIYGVASGNWSPTGPLNSLTASQPFSPPILVQDGRAMIKHNGEHSNSNWGVEIFTPGGTPATSLWSTPLYQPAHDHEGGGMVALSDGHVLLAGGVPRGCNGPYLVESDVESWNPSTQQWTIVGSLSTPRTRFSMGLRPDGTVLIAGGCYDCACNYRLSTSEVFDPRPGPNQYQSYPSPGGMFSPRSNFFLLQPLPGVGGTSGLQSN